MKSFTTTILPLIAFTFTAVSFADAPVTLQREGDQITVKIGDAPLAVYNTSKELAKPFFSPVYDPNGTIISRPLENPEDHKHHKGIWVSIDEVNGIKFWAETGKIENISAALHDADGDGPASLQVVNHWQGEDGKPVVIETTTIGIFPNRLMTYDIVFTATDGPVTFGDTKEGLLGFRMINSMREKETGKVVNADGKQGTAECWGQPSAWVDYYGEAEGKIVGVTLMDHPDNFRPSRYHVRDYGLFSMSPFGEKAYTGGASESEPVVVEKGESLRLRYGLYIHNGDTLEGKVAEAYKQFLSATK
ncbi:MAG: PmoA family protein [Planctomycetota bacterium]